jgi:preprotein translocase subunit SecA
VADAVEGAFGLCMPVERFPSEWRCERLRDWLRSVGLGQVVGAEDVRDEVLAEIQGYFERAAAGAQAERPPEFARADTLTAALQICLETSLSEEGRNFNALANAVATKFGVELDPFELSKLPADELEATLRKAVLDAYERRKNELTSQRMLWTVRQLLLQTIDIKWKDHLYDMDHLRGTIGFRGYGQQDPKVEYKREGTSMFDLMTKSIEDTVTDYVLKVEFNLGEEEARRVWRADSYVHEASESFRKQQEVAEAPMGGKPTARPVAAAREPGRNDPCPCGKKRPDGKPVKYKNCCGRRRGR